MSDDSDGESRVSIDSLASAQRFESSDERFEHSAPRFERSDERLEHGAKQLADHDDVRSAGEQTRNAALAALSAAVESIEVAELGRVTLIADTRDAALKHFAGP